MKTFAQLLVCALIASSSCSPAASKSDVKRQVNVESADSTTPPCSLSVYRYLYNMAGTQVRPNLPAGTVMFGRALPPAGPTDFRDFDEAGSKISPSFQQDSATKSPSYPQANFPQVPLYQPQYRQHESGSKIDAPEPIKPEGSASGAVPNFSYLPPDNNYLPPPPNNNYFPAPPSPAPNKPNYFIPIGAVTIGSSTPAPEEEVGSSTPIPELPSTVTPEVPISSTVQPEIPVSTFGPDYPGIISSTPASLYPPSTPSPPFPAYPAAQHPEVNLFAPPSFPVAPVPSGGPKCICEDGKGPINPNPNQLDFKSPVIISSTPKPAPVPYEHGSAELNPVLNENSIYYSFSNLKPFPHVHPSTPAPPLFISTTPAPELSSTAIPSAPPLFVPSTPQPELKFYSSTPLPSPPTVSFPSFDYSSSPPAFPNIAPPVQPQQPYYYKPAPSFPLPLPPPPPPPPVVPVNAFPLYPQPSSTQGPLAPSFPLPLPPPPPPPPVVPVNAFPLYPQPSTQGPLVPSSTPGYQYPNPLPPLPKPTLPPIAPDAGYEYPKPSVPFPSETGNGGYSYPKPKTPFSF